MGGFLSKTVTDRRGRWQLEQLGPLDLCLLQADLVRTLGEPLRAALRGLLAYLGEPSAEGEQPFAKLERVLKTLLERPKDLLGSVMDRPWDELRADADRVVGTFVEMLQVLPPVHLRRFAELLLVRQPGRPKGGLRVAPTAGADPTLDVDSLARLDELLADNPLEFWRLLLWAFEVNLRPLIAASATGLGRGNPSPATPGSPS